MRAAYLGQDRLDISEAVKCLSQAMANPREGHLAQLKRLERYLGNRPRTALKYEAQESRLARIQAYTDSDWAGEAISRRSTSGMVIRRGSHIVRHSSTLQTSIGLSSAEAEYYAMTKGAACALGIQSLLKDWGLDNSIELYSDSSSARSFAKRRGLGKQRHIDTRYLWLQDHVAAKMIKVFSVRTDENPADVFTKALTRQMIDYHCRGLKQTDLDPVEEPRCKEDESLGDRQQQQQQQQQQQRRRKVSIAGRNGIGVQSPHPKRWADMEEEDDDPRGCLGPWADGGVRSETSTDED